jgi:hypothetical protein
VETFRSLDVALDFYGILKEDIVAGEHFLEARAVLVENPVTLVFYKSFVKTMKFFYFSLVFILISI